ncbi:MAG: quinone-dependent dihydroorotate dehydrogenase [Rhodospirillales bacterium]|nr:quinone-dependent dihydroorotate dehydrogenase [Rhodospirillales bacterium]
MIDFYPIARPVMFRMDPERAHRLTVMGLKTGLMPCGPVVSDPALKVALWGRHFPNPVGLAAGFDKNAEVIGPMLRFGFGFVEIGTVTPKPQHGNPKPRIFRAPNQEAVINAMGFPNEGVIKFKENLQKFLGRKPRPAGIVGLNIGMNKSQTEPVKDYRALVQQLAPLADYLTINISSPNTPGLRDLQEPKHLKALLEQVIEERNKACKIDPPPLLLKLAPDLSENQQGAIAETVLNSGVDGLILTNTTLDRPDTIPSDFAAQKGGLSGVPLREKSTAVIASFYKLTGGKVPIIGVGGISSGADAYEKIKAGASLVQLYSALVFRGPDVVQAINKDILEYLKQDGFSHVSEAVGQSHAPGAKKNSQNNRRAKAAKGL